MFDYDDSINLAFDAKIAGKSLVAAKHELLTKTGDFLFLAHTDRELAFRMQMVEQDIEKVAYHKLANISDSKAKLVRTIHEEWQLRHAGCEFCKGSNPYDPKKDPNKDNDDNPSDYGTGKLDHVPNFPDKKSLNPNFPDKRPLDPKKAPNKGDDDNSNERHEWAEWDDPHAKPYEKPYVKPNKPNKGFPSKQQPEGWGKSIEKTYDPKWEIPADPHAKPYESPFTKPYDPKSGPNSGSRQYFPDKQPNKLDHTIDHTKFINDPNGNK
jgi:hypothetical protein